MTPEQYEALQSLRDVRADGYHAALDAALAEDFGALIQVLYGMDADALEALHEAATKVAKEALDATPKDWA